MEQPYTEQTAKDRSGNGNDGAIIGGDAKQVDGKNGKGLEMDGADDHVRIEYNDSLLIDDAVTFAGWFFSRACPVTGPG